MCSKVQYCFDVMVCQYLADQCLVTGITLDQFGANDSIGKTGRQIIQHDHRPSGPGQHTYHMTADVAGAPRYKNFTF